MTGPQVINELWSEKETSVFHDYVHTLLHYNQETGVFTRLVDRKRWKAGSIAGNIDGDGYQVISIDGRSYKAHRLAWLYITGRWPEYQIDHRDCIKSNNAWNNLREATHKLQQKNKVKRSDNSSGHSNITIYESKTKGTRYEVSVQTIRGTFDSLEEALAVRDSAYAEHGYPRIKGR